MGALVTLFSKMCEKEHDKDLQIHDVDIVCCSTVQDSSESDRDDNKIHAHA